MNREMKTKHTLLTGSLVLRLLSVKQNSIGNEMQDYGVRRADRA